MPPRTRRPRPDGRNRSEERMRFEGTVDIAAPREKAWAFLIDAEQVGPCGPGVESIEVVDATHFKARAKVGVGFISARFLIALEMTDLDAPSHPPLLAHRQAPGSAAAAPSRTDLPHPHA